MSGETKWTPGPWRVSHRGGYSKIENVAIVTGEGDAERDIIGGCGECGSAWCENEADQPLLAAAPDLYAALADLVDRLERLGPINTPTLIAAQAALAKARGETP